MRSLRRVLRIVRIAATGIGAFLLLALAIVQGEQRLQRSRSERLLRQMQVVDLRATTSSDVERRFGRFATKSAKCDNASCDYAIQLESPFGFQVAINFLQHLHVRSDLVFHTLLRLGVRPAQVKAHIEIRNGIAWGKGMTVTVAALGPKDDQGRWWDYELIGRAESISAFHDYFELRSDLLHHPDYIIGKPGGCDGPCVEGHVLFTPYAAAEDVQRLMHFDMSCLTRWWQDCRKQGDIIPGAWAQYEQEQNLPNPAANELSNPRLVQILGRDATAIAIVRISSIDRHNEPREYVFVDGQFRPTGKTYVEQRAKARVLEMLKGGLWHGGEDITLQASEPELPFHDSQHMIVLLDPIWTERANSAFGVRAWQVLPPSRENLDLVRLGMAEDYEGWPTK